MKELYCGVDIHKEKYVGCIIDSKGKVIREASFPSTKEAVQSFMCGIPVKGVVVEACGMWRFARKSFTELGCDFKLCDAKKVKDIAGRKKTDKIDAKTLANLLRTEFLPEVYIPTDEILELRDLTRNKEYLTRARVKVQNTIKHYMLKIGIKYPTNLWSIKGIKWLSSLDDLNLKNWLRVYQSFIAEEKEALGRIRKKAKLRKITNLLMTMPGIAEFSALMILAEIADINRFETPKHLVMYAGLCPGVYQTGETEIKVMNNAVNKHLKWIITECSGISTRHDEKYQKYYAKINKRRGSKIARRATARRMLTIIWHMMKNEEPYRNA